MEVEIFTMDNFHTAKINGAEIKNVTDYGIITSANGTTEVTLKFKIEDNVKIITLSKS